MPDRTEANPNELNQDDARYGFRCCHLKNIWTAPLPPEPLFRSEERFSRNAETDIVCRLLLEKKNASVELHAAEQLRIYISRADRCEASWFRASLATTY